MLRELRVKNFAIIDTLSLSFSEGLNILSGETGAGKSIIVGALTLLLGGKASGEMVRASEESAVVEALFDGGQQDPIVATLKGWGIEPDENVLLKRVISHRGKSKAFINGDIATVQMLTLLGMDLISISGQHEHQTLLVVDNHIDILDAFGNLVPLRNRVEQGYRTLLKLYRKRQELERDESDKVQKSEFLRFQIKEIEDAHLKTGEEEELKEEKNILSHAQKLVELTEAAYGTLYHNQHSVMEHLRESLASLREVAAIDSSTSPLFTTLETALYQIEDVAHSLKDYSEKIDFAADRLEAVAIRLDEINKLKKKYGESLEKILRSRAQAQAELERIESNEAALEMIVKEQQKIEKETMRLAMDLSHRRSQVAPQLSEKVKDELVSLGMKKAFFTVQLTTERGEGKTHARGFVPLGDFTLNERGLDEAEFLFGPNPGEGLKPLAKIASGGELSRIILALKKIVASTTGAATLIFDEVDSGIGGATAEVVGRKLKEISRWQQTICITHLPQIASFADLHQTIAKQVNKGRTKTFVRQLDSPQEREEEVARMLGGTTITAKTREHAREMLKTAQGMA